MLKDFIAFAKDVEAMPATQELSAFVNSIMPEYIPASKILPPMLRPILGFWLEGNYPGITSCDEAGNWSHWGREELGFCPMPDYWLPLPPLPIEAIDR